MFFFERRESFFVAGTSSQTAVDESQILLSQVIVGLLGILGGWTCLGSIGAWGALAGCLAAWIPAFWTAHMHRRQRKTWSGAMDANPFGRLRAVLFIRLYGFLLSSLLLFAAFIYVPPLGLWSVFVGFVLTLKGHALWGILRFFGKRVRKWPRSL
jgi:hypothetical protein